MHSYKLTIIRENASELLERLVTDDALIEAMKSKSCFTQQQLTIIQSVSDLHERNKMLLEILSRSSLEKFNRFVDLLRAMKPHIVPLLTGNEGKQSVNRCMPQIVTQNFCRLL